MSAFVAFFLLFILYCIGPSIHNSILEYACTRREATAAADPRAREVTVITSISHRKRVWEGRERGGRKHLMWGPQLASQFGRAKFGH
uniref:Secreted protein n=1 Tax=Oryza sativa subsp. japonica TaxID=39947 RepID=Q8H3X7_ORYSJ|nr:hypothetical protein [Oryza sativa Japonica Group]